MQAYRFRMYDRKREEWVHDTDHAVSLFGETIIMGEILRRSDDTGVSLEDLNEIVVQMYINCRDKNGKDIYDGDVLKMHTGDVVEVQWGTNQLAWIVTKDGLNALIPNREAWEEAEIIGNKFDNKELLNG